MGRSSVKTDRDAEAFYSLLKYPGPDALITYVWAKRIRPFLRSGSFCFLDAGCGSGRHSAGILLTYPDARGVGLDVSEPSLIEARALMETKNIEDRIEFIHASFSKPLPISEKFDLVLAVGSIHHSPNPKQSLNNIAKVLKPEGILAGMVYGRRGHQRRYEIKEMLEILGGDDVELRLSLLRSYNRKYRTILDVPLRQWLSVQRKRLSQWRHRMMGKAGDFGYCAPSTTDKTFLLDSYTNPIDFAFDSRELRQMFESCGLELVHMFTLGRLDPALLPADWWERWEKLDLWDKVRISELIDPVPASFSFIAKKV